MDKIADGSPLGCPMKEPGALRSLLGRTNRDWWPNQLPLDILHQRGVTALAHGLDDVEHALVDRVIGHTFPAQQMIQMSGEIRISSVETGNCSGHGHGEGLDY